MSNHNVKLKNNLKKKFNIFFFLLGLLAVKIISTINGIAGTAPRKQKVGKEADSNMYPVSTTASLIALHFTQMQFHNNNKLHWPST